MPFQTFFHESKQHAACRPVLMVSDPLDPLGDLDRAVNSEVCGFGLHMNFIQGTMDHRVLSIGIFRIFRIFIAY